VAEYVLEEEEKDFLMDQDYSKKYPKRNTTNDRKVSKVS
jgi:hypothetical protein